MINFNYREGKRRIEKILEEDINIKDTNEISQNIEEDLNEVYYTWVGAISINIKNFSFYYPNKKKEDFLKIAKGLVAELIEILKYETSYIDVGIYNDTVYGIYLTPTKGDTYKLYEKIIFINTYLKMINKILLKKGYKAIKIGIGAAASKEFLLKLRIEKEMNIWMGEAVEKAYELSKIANSDENEIICISKTLHHNIKEQAIKKNGEKFMSWFILKNNSKYGEYFTGNLLKSKFNNWINNEMKETD